MLRLTTGRRGWGKIIRRDLLVLVAVHDFKAFLLLGRREILDRRTGAKLF